MRGFGETRLLDLSSNCKGARACGTKGERTTARGGPRTVGEWVRLSAGRESLNVANRVAPRGPSLVSSTGDAG